MSEKMIQMLEWQLKQIENTLRLTSNLHESHNKETCFDRMVCKSWNWVKKALELNEKAKTYIIWNNIEMENELESYQHTGYKDKCEKCEQLKHKIEQLEKEIEIYNTSVKRRRNANSVWIADNTVYYD